MPLQTSLLLAGMHLGPATPPVDWPSLSLVSQDQPWRVRVVDGFALKADKMLIRAGLTLLNGMAGGQPLDPVSLLPTAR